MNAYRYKALSRDGAAVDGLVEAFDEFEAAAQIKRECPIILKIEQVPEKRERIDLNEPLWISEKVLVMVCSQFSILLRAGLPMVRTVELIAEQTNDRLMKKVLNKVAADVAAGFHLADSFEKNGKKIPIVFIETVRAGEESGTLESSFARLSKYFDKSYKLKSKVRGAMMYPAFLCVLAIGVIIIVMTFTMPVITNVMLSFGNVADMPLPTRLLMALSDFMQNDWFYLVIFLVLVITACVVYGKTENGRRRFSVLSLRIPIIGKINLMKSAAQFANTLSTLLTAGLPMTRALTATGKVMDNYAMGLAVGGTTVGIEEGRGLGEVIRSDPYLPALLKEMAAVGEESGSLEDTLGTIGDFYDAEAETATAKALSMLEPMITVIMGVVIGFIVIALYVPMFNMYGGMS